MLTRTPLRSLFLPGGRGRSAGALHVGILPVEIEVQRAAQTRAQVAAAHGETTRCRIGGRFCRSFGHGDVRE
jgi:hypothetical protein